MWLAVCLTLLFSGISAEQLCSGRETESACFEAYVSSGASSCGYGDGCTDCASKSVGSCEAGAYSQPTGCVYNYAASQCQSIGYDGFFFLSQGVCESSYGQKKLQRLAWNSTYEKCMECDCFSALSCPSPRCTVAESLCVSPQTVCATGTTIDECSRSDNAMCFWDGVRCLWCGAFCDAAKCSASLFCTFDEAAQFCVLRGFSASQSAVRTATSVNVGAAIGGCFGLALLFAGGFAVYRHRRSSAQRHTVHREVADIEVPPRPGAAAVEMHLVDTPSSSELLMSSTVISSCAGPVAAEGSSDCLDSDKDPRTHNGQIDEKEEHSRSAVQGLPHLQRKASGLAILSAPKVREYIASGRVTRLKHIARGANGSVASCVLPDGTIIAVKEVLMPAGSASDEVVVPLMMEFDLVSSLEHPNVVKFFGARVDRVECKLSIFMELVPTGSLASMVRGMAEPMEEGLARVYVKQLVLGLAYIHSRGVVHRDLKCDNILLSSDGTIKVTDFGASKKIGTCTMATQAAQTMVGTPFFMAPEVLSATEDDEEAATLGYGRRADVWSLGITILEMLERGKMPWPDFPSVTGALMHIATPGSLPVIPGRLSEQARDFISRCCTRDPTKRATSEELATHPWLLAG